jgi:hypothetical protein
MSEPNGRGPDEPQPTDPSSQPPGSGREVDGGSAPDVGGSGPPADPPAADPDSTSRPEARAAAVADDDLIHELRSLGRAVSVPAPPPDLATAVLSRLEPAPAPRPTPLRRAAGHLARLSRGARAAVVVVVALLLAVGAAAPAGASIARWLGIGGVVIVEAPGAPAPPAPAAPGGAAGAGGAVSLADARAQAPFPVVVPAGLGDPDRVVLTTDGPPETFVVSMEWLTTGVRLDQFAGRVEPVFVKRYYDEVQWLTVGDDDSAVWLSQPHPLEYIDPSGTPRTESARTAGPSLIWQRGAVTLRLEGVPTVERAVALADSVS